MQIYSILGCWYTELISKFEAYTLLSSTRRFRWLGVWLAPLSTLPGHKPILQAAIFTFLSHPDKRKKTVKFPCTVHHSDNKQTNKYKQNINLYVCIKMKVRSFRSHVFDSSSSFPLSRPYPGFCPLKANYPLLCTPAVTVAILSAGERLSLPLCLLSKDNADALNFLPYSFRTRGGSPSPSNPRVPPSLPGLDQHLSHLRQRRGASPLSFCNLKSGFVGLQVCRKAAEWRNYTKDTRR